MNILAQALQLENSENLVYRLQALEPHTAELEKQYRDAGYQKRERSYKIKYQHKEYTVICAEFRDDKNGGEPIFIIPEFLVPGRPYPIYVYLYAIDLYKRCTGKRAADGCRGNAQIFRAGQFCPHDTGTCAEDICA